MTSMRLLRLVQDLSPSQFSEATIMMWISQVEQMLACDVLEIDPALVPEITEPTQAQMVVPHPYDRVYLPYVQAMIANAQGETDLYQNYLMEYNAFRDDWASWVLNGGNRESKWYVSAYQLACEQGFVGTIQQWLESHKGEKGDGVIIKGHFETLEELEQAKPVGTVGDYYEVGTSAEEYLVYYWDRNAGKWHGLDLIAGEREAKEAARQAKASEESASRDAAAAIDAAATAEAAKEQARDAEQVAVLAAASAEASAAEAKSQAEGVEDLTDAEEGFRTLESGEYTAVEGKFVRGDNGKQQEDERWDYYVVRVTAGDVYRVTTTANGSIAAWIERNSDTKLIRTADQIAGQQELVSELTISENATELVVNHRKSQRTVIERKIYVRHITETESKRIVERSGIESVERLDDSDIYAAGTALSTAQRWLVTVSGYSVVRLPMYPGMHLIISTNATNSGVGFGFFSEADKYLDGADYASGRTFDVAAPAGTAYAFITLVNGKTVSIATRTSQKTISKAIASPVDDANPLALVDGFPTLIRCFRKIVCVGDSLTRGQFDTTYPTSSGADVGTAFSYPAQLAKMTGCNVINLGIGGATASRQNGYNWMSVMERSGIFPASDFLENPGDAYIIALGTNDLSSADTGNMFSGDVETDIAVDWRDNAQTSVGGYAAIIQRILEMQPKAKIFCVTIPKTRNIGVDKTVANAKIAAIAERFGGYLIDLYTYAEHRYGIFNDAYKNSGHNNALGYNLRARQYAAYIDWIMEHNLESFRNIAFIGTDYEFQK